MSQLPSHREEGARGVKTSGIGRMTTAHLNLTRNLADVERDNRDFIVRWREEHRDPAQFQNGKISYSGK